MKHSWFCGVHALRAVAALLVLLQHSLYFALPSALKADLGAIGVFLFFCISGFVIGGLRHQSAATFLMHRALRIYPPFWCAYLLSAVIVLPNFTRFSLWTAFLLPDISESAIYIPIWTLVYEIAFYAVAAALFSLRLSDRILSMVMLTWIVIVQLGQGYITHTSITKPDWNILLSPYTQLFALGFLCAVHLERLRHIPPEVYMIGAIIALVISQSFPGIPDNRYTLAFGVFLCALIMVSIHIRSTPKTLAVLADASYGIYLIHMSVVVTLAEALSPWLSSPALAMAVFGLSLLIGTVFGLAEFSVHRWVVKRMKAPPAAISPAQASQPR